MEYLEKHESMTVETICALFQVSRDTARRDVVKLTQQGAVLRTHGGIALSKFNRKIQEYGSRLDHEPEVKVGIGVKAAAYVKDNEMIFLDVSTTVQCMIPHLRAQALAVVTHSLDNAWFLMENEQIQTYLLGGRLQPKSRHLAGYDTLKKLDDYRFTKIFLGASGLSDGSIYYCHEDDIRFKRELVKRAEEVIVLADHTKFEKYSLYKVLTFDAVNTIITDQPVSQAMQETLAMQDVQLIISQG